MGAQKLLLLFSIVAADASAAAPHTPAPLWPANAELSCEAYQPLYDEPARTEAEAARRERSYGVTLQWPSALGAVKQYELRKDGKLLARLSPRKLQHLPDGMVAFDKTIERPDGQYEVRAGDGFGHWSTLLGCRWTRPPLFPDGNEPVLNGGHP